MEFLRVIEKAFEPYQHLDPIGWVGVYRSMTLPVAVGAIALGVVMLLLGGRRLFRVVAAPLGALLPFVWGATVAQHLGFGAKAAQIVPVSAAVLFVAGMAVPQIVLFFAFGVPCGLLIATLVGNTDWMLGFAPGLMVGGAIGVVMHRTVGAIVSAIAGGWVVTLGLLAALTPYVPQVSWLAVNPIVVMSIAGCIAVAGVSYQLFVRLSPEEAEKRKFEKAAAKKRQKENEALEKRWSKYTGGKKG